MSPSWLTAASAAAAPAMAMAVAVRPVLAAGEAAIRVAVTVAGMVVCVMHSGLRAQHIDRISI